MSLMNGRQSGVRSQSGTCCSRARSAPLPSPASPRPSCPSPPLATSKRRDANHEYDRGLERARHRRSNNKTTASVAGNVTTSATGTPSGGGGGHNDDNDDYDDDARATATESESFRGPRREVCCQITARGADLERACHTRASSPTLPPVGSSSASSQTSGVRDNNVDDPSWPGGGGNGHGDSSARRATMAAAAQAAPGRWRPTISDVDEQRQRVRLTRARAAPRGSNVTGRRRGKSELSGVALAAILMVLAHICQILLPLKTTSDGHLVGVALAQTVDHDQASRAAVEGGEPRQARSPGEDSDNAGEPPLVAQGESWRARPESTRDLRDARLADKLMVNMSNVFEVLLKKRPYSRYWTVEQKWDDLFVRGLAVQGTMRQMMMKNFLRDIEYYADVTISPQCEKDLKFIQNYARQSTNFRWLAHMFDSTGKSEPGMLTGMLAHMGHPVQCIRVRAPARPSNDTFDERFFEEQTRVLGERFRGKYCLASVRPVMPPKPAGQVVSRFSALMDSSLLSNISYTGEPAARLKQRARQMTVPLSAHANIDREHLRLDQVPFESELYQYLIAQRNFMFALPRLMGVCYPSSCTRDDIRMSLQKTLDDQHQVADIEFECEQEEVSAWDWFNTPRLLAYVLLTLVVVLVFSASLARYVLLSKLQISRSKLAPGSKMAGLLEALDMFSMDKCAGTLFVKTKRASAIVDWTKVENNRSTTIDALKGALILILVYSQMTVLGCLPLPFMWSKWSDAMFPFFRSLSTQPFINLGIWSEAFYMISAYLIALKVLENHRPRLTASGGSGENFRKNLLASALDDCGRSPSNSCPLPSFFSFAIKRYVRLALPMLAFMLLNYVWPRLSNGFVMQDQAAKLMQPCDTLGWTNFLMFHNHNPLGETCLWPSHVSASFFQLHLLSYPLLILCTMALHSQFNLYGDYVENKQRRRVTVRVLTSLAFGLMAALALLGAIYPALQASKRSLIVPFLIDYIDYDNYQRVLEWTILPTYNHLTSYMLGLALAFVVVRRKALGELRRLEANEWFGAGGTGAGVGGANCGLTGQYSLREGSVESIKSSSTQELHQDSQLFKQPFARALMASASLHRPGRQANQAGHFNLSSGESSVCDASSERADQDDASLCRDTTQPGWSEGLRSLICCLVCLGSLLASWLWNGLGQPMSDEQTFWYMVLTKVCFCAAFAGLFHEHFATRRNSCNPWVVTRFLVPIGRMSLTVFYVSWLVIWFDVLSSLHQWHPSHYFICEKYNEIIFITLIVAMLVYGAFEGIFKRVQYAGRLQRVKHDIGLLMSLAAGVRNNGAPVESSRRARSLKAKPFESFFDPHDKPSWEELAGEFEHDGEGEQEARSRVGDNKSADPANGSRASSDGPRSTMAACTVAAGDLSANARSGYLTPSGGGLTPASTSCNLSPSDRYKLNAELRANYSFASIGLYESAGATADLSQLSSASDPQGQRR